MKNQHKNISISRFCILGNSCRSPIAEAVFCDQLKQMDLNEFWEVDSAALLQYHVGKSPEPRAMSTLRKNGINNYSHKARPVGKFFIIY